MVSIFRRWHKKLNNEPELILNCMKNHTPEDIALIVPTSGSTGPPKPAMISFKNIYFIGNASEKVIKKEKKIMSFHIYHYAMLLSNYFLYLMLCIVDILLILESL